MTESLTITEAPARHGSSSGARTTPSPRGLPRAKQEIWDQTTLVFPRDEAGVKRSLAACRRTALVMAGLCEELACHAPSDEELQAMVWASYRVFQWISRALDMEAEPSLLRCLAEAACANMALRGLAYEYSATRQHRVRLNSFVLGQSRKVGALLAEASSLAASPRPLRGR